ncbi:MAG: formimidoylglutamate deiminase [Ilumatobacter sp.]|uniref:formimidoylglutamate deiminase n=1 Tax=Ilumatobacter sp. TaxID=1967498 RepID=UPI002634D558|nr:formimidoylglutamate deiminase [Ilumatobacter sp.]MDJ0768915.1 formimidoylglutamate deiminase [Ilumatobacter sp.]
MTSTDRLIWCEYAVLPAGVAEGVTIEVAGGRCTTVTTDTEPQTGGDRRAGITLPGAANTHSHAFHRALRHRSQTGRGSFWTWREQMYAIAEALDPDRYHRLARAVFAEMTLAGFTAVGEFHYVHHQADGSPYAEPNAMGLALVEAARDAGVRITLLDTIYLHGGLDAGGYRPLEGAQRRFGDGSFDGWAERVAAVAPAPHLRIGAAVHSVRAVDPAAIAAVGEWAGGAPLHAHVSEQRAENEACHAAHASSPTEVFDRAGAVTPTFTAVHATHATDGDVDALGRADAAVCLCPTTERDLGDGVGPASRLARAGVTLAIGSDSHAVVDPFEEARLIELHERLVTGARGVFDAGDLAATMHAGHQALGWDDAGSIDAGQRADLVTVSLSTPRTAGATLAPDLTAVVFAAGAADVTHVTIDGVDVVADRRHATVDVATEMPAAIEELTP